MYCFYLYCRIIKWNSRANWLICPISIINHRRYINCVIIRQYNWCNRRLIVWSPRNRRSRLICSIREANSRRWIQVWSTMRVIIMCFTLMWYIIVSDWGCSLRISFVWSRRVHITVRWSATPRRRLNCCSRRLSVRR